MECARVAALTFGFVPHCHIRGRHAKRFLEPCVHGGDENGAKQFYTARNLAQIRVNRPTWRTILAFDASLTAGSVVYSTASPEVANFILESYQNQYAARKKRSATKRRIESALPPLVSHSQKIEGLVVSKNWTTTLTRLWQEPAHINFLELTTATMAFEWASSFTILGHRVLLLSDSLVTVGPLTKGRSSARGLTAGCRKFAALSIAHNIQPYLCHVPTHLNPADGLSRPRRQPK